MKKILITGSTGFAGGHLTDYLSSKNEYEIYGTSLIDSNPNKNSKIQIKKVDLTVFDEVRSIIEEIKPDIIYHLASFTSPSESFNNPTPVVIANIQIQMNLLNAITDLGLTDCRLLLVSSADVYGMVEDSDLPINEQTPMRPCNPYAVSKIAQDFLGLQYHLAYKLDIVRVRPFNHTGPGQSDSFAIASFAHQIAVIEKGKQEPVLKVGNLSAKRDFSDVRDIVKGYSQLVEKGVSGEVYNIGSGKSHSMKDLLDILLSLSTTKIEIRDDPSKSRPIDVENVYCDYKKLNLLTGWVPEIPIEKTLQDTLDYWRGIV